MRHFPLHFLVLKILQKKKNKSRRKFSRTNGSALPGKRSVRMDKSEETVKVRSEEKDHPCLWEKVGDRYVVYRSSDNKVMKSIKYFAPDLTQFFTDEELRQTTGS